MKNNKTIYLMGGFGNVLFQINYGYFLIKKGYEVEFATILISSNKILNKILGFSDHRTLETIIAIGLNKKIRMINGSILSLIMFFISKVIKKPFNRHCFNGMFREKNSEDWCNRLLGYYHLNVPVSDRFRSDMISLSKSYINNKDVNFLEKINKLSGAQLIHYRAGDYLLLQEFQQISDLYFSQTLDNCNKKYLVSNDDAYSLKYLSSLSNQDIEPISDATALDDFILIMHSSNLILSNSTFSWWAAEFSSAEKIYQPDPFFSHLKWNPETNKNRIKVKIEIKN
jgi:hypothetical protein